METPRSCHIAQSDIMLHPRWLPNSSWLCPKNMVPYGTLQISWFHKIWFNLSSSVPLLLRIAITDQNPFENTEYTPFSDFSDKPCYLSSYIPANEYHPQFLPTGYTSVKSPMAIFQDCCFHCIPDCQVYSKTYDSAEPQ